MKVTRRHVLAGLALLAAAGAVGVGGVGVAWYDQDPAAPLRVLSADEAEILDAIAEAAWPAGGTPALGGRDAGLPRFLDAVLVGMPEVQRDLLRFSLHAVDALSLPTHGARFRHLAAADAEAALAAGLAHPVAELRSLVQSFHIFAGMAYLAHPEVAPLLVPMFGCGFGGEPA